MNRKQLDQLFGNVQISKEEVLTVLFEAFEVKNTQELSCHLTKTDMDSVPELLWAVQVVWTNSPFYDVVNRRALQKGLVMIPSDKQKILAIAAK
jgi:hypothetical protein